MTQQYLAGELSVLLAGLPVVTTDEASSEAAVRLRHLAETVPIADLGDVVVRALELTNSLCWESLERGDGGAFARQAEMAAELREFGVCARLLRGRRRTRGAWPNGGTTDDDRAGDTGL